MAGEVKIKIEVVGSDQAQSQIKKVTNTLGNGSSSGGGSGLTGAVFKANIATMALSKGFEIVTNAGQQFIGYLQDASKNAQNFEKSMITLDIVSGRFGVSGDKAKKAADELGRSLKIGVGPAAESIQNLLKGGLSLEQSTELLKRFTNEAITGKSANISLGEAVNNLSFAYITQNSALGNMSGISENFSDIIDRGRKALLKQGVAANKITDDMAKFKGMMDLTEITLGASTKLTEGLTGSQADLDQTLLDTSTTVGTFINPALDTLNRSILVPLATAFQTLVTKGIAVFNKALEDNKPFIDDIKKGLGEIGSIITGSDIPGSLGNVGTSLRETFSDAMRIILRDTAASIKSFIEYLKSPEGQQALKNYARDFNSIADAIKGVYNIAKQTKPLIEFFGRAGKSITDNPLKAIVPIIPFFEAAQGMQKKHNGGMIEGTPGSDVPTIMQAGEFVIPKKMVDEIRNGTTYNNDNKKTNNLTINVNGGGQGRQQTQDMGFLFMNLLARA